MHSFPYQPVAFTGTIQDLPAYLERELGRFLEMLQGGDKVLLIAKSHAAPPKPRDGVVAYADGTNWNPAAGGEGFYGYYAGAWHKLG